MKNQIEKLAEFIMNEVDGEPSQDEGAGDCAIRLLKSYKEQITAAKLLAEKPISKVTTSQLDMALRMVEIELDMEIIDKIIDLVELIEDKGGKTSLKDVCKLQAIWDMDKQQTMTEAIKLSLEHLQDLSDKAVDQHKWALTYLLISLGDKAASDKVIKRGIPTILYCSLQDHDSLRFIFKDFPSLHIITHQLLKDGESILVWSEGFPTLESVQSLTK